MFPWKNSGKEEEQSQHESDDCGNFLSFREDYS